MKQLVILSGKGGTGKTTIAAAFAHLASQAGVKVVLADADVDAANLELVLSPQQRYQEAFFSGFEAYIHAEECIACGTCQELCRFDAISAGETYHVDPFSCEGCGVCATYCPTQAIEMRVPHCGESFVSDTPYGTLVHAHLFPGAENSGKLVTLVKQKAEAEAHAHAADAVVVDGPPGIGCAVIAATTGASVILAVTEPTPAGLHDLERLISLAEHFHIKHVDVCINKYDLHEEGTRHIENFCRERELTIVGRIPYDEDVLHTMIQGRPITSEQHSPAAAAIREVWEKLRPIFAA